MVKAAKPHPVDAARRKLGEASLKLLAKHNLDALRHDLIADEAGVDAELAMRLFPDMADIIGQGLADLDADIINDFARDIAEDPEAAPREKILEGLIRRFETYTRHKDAMRALARAAKTHPAIAFMMVGHLTDAMTALLDAANAAGDGPIRKLRAKGLAAVCIAVWRDWIKDETPDLAETCRALDRRLRQAEEIASTFGIVQQEKTKDTE